MTGRRQFLIVLPALAVAGWATAQGRSARVGYLVQSPLGDPPSPERAAFLDELRRLGYAPGENATIEYRSAENDPEFLDDLVRELLARQVQVIVAASSLAAARAAARLTRTIPIVFIGVLDPVGAGLVRSLARPDGNVTGVAWESENLVAKRIELLKELVPGTTRLAIIWSPDNPEAVRTRDLILRVAAASRMRVDEHGIRDTATLRNAFATLDRDRPHALYVVTDQRMVAYREIISAEAIRLRLPTASNYQGFADAGGLLAYSADLAEIYRRGAAYVARILDGAKPGELPVEQPTRLELVLNLKTAKSIGIKVPQSILLRADRVIQG